MEGSTPTPKVDFGPATMARVEALVKMLIETNPNSNEVLLDTGAVTAILRRIPQGSLGAVRQEKPALANRHARIVLEKLEKRGLARNAVELRERYNQLLWTIHLGQLRASLEAKAWQAAIAKGLNAAEVVAGMWNIDLDPEKEKPKRDIRKNLEEVKGLASDSSIPFVLSRVPEHLTMMEREAAVKLAEDGWRVYHSGWPDFLCVRGEDVKFVEVKAKTDAQSTEQKKVMSILASLGFDVEIQGGRSTGLGEAYHQTTEDARLEFKQGLDHIIRQMATGTTINPEDLVLRAHKALERVMPWKRKRPDIPPAWRFWEEEE